MEYLIVDINQKPPSSELYLIVMRSSLMKGESLSNWCKENNVARSNVVSALTGAWNGPKAKVLRARVIKESGMGI